MTELSYVAEDLVGSITLTPRPAAGPAAAASVPGLRLPGHHAHWLPLPVTPWVQAGPPSPADQRRIQQQPLTAMHRSIRRKTQAQSVHEDSTAVQAGSHEMMK
jgi:hypothetical protein